MVFLLLGEQNVCSAHEYDFLPGCMEVLLKETKSWNASEKMGKYEK